MVIDGQVRIRTFDRIADREGAILILPTGDHVGRVGESASMTTAKDNVHWFAPATPHAVTFDVIISDLDPGQASYLVGHHLAHKRELERKRAALAAQPATPR